MLQSFIYYATKRILVPGLGTIVLFKSVQVGLVDTVTQIYVELQRSLVVFYLTKLANVVHGVVEHFRIVLGLGK